ncbi:MAG: XdhC family protein [Verrucomicrobiae bacterium]|nr:XdhC family protein [Verrucomicrobiae bacterium]
MALATVVSAKGSTPRVPGARQFLPVKGAPEGTIGGGATEARILELAQQTLEDGQPRTFEADLRGRPGDIREGICGGIMTVWIVRLTPAQDMSVIQALNTALENGKSVTLLTRLVSPGPVSLAGVGGPVTGEVFEEEIEPAPQLLVVGAGHIGRALARLMDELDFNICIHDDRQEWLEPGCFPKRCRLEKNLRSCVERLKSWRGEMYAVLVTRGYGQDVEAMEALAGVHSLKYLGLLGSRPRVSTVLAALGERNVVFSEKVLHAPIGIEIGAETPMEIAVSIGAELIRVRRRPREAATRSNP